jgi:DNA-binding beta-propeller fold protein YncE
MLARGRLHTTGLAVLLLAPVALTQEKGGQEEFGHYEHVANWPQPLPGPENQGWTWGSTGGVYAESPDRVWIGMRGQLPLPEKAKPGDSVGLHKMNANQLRPKTRWTNQVIVVDRDGKLVQSFAQHDELLAKGGKGPHQINMSPYDPEKHVWVVSDSGHAVFKFTNDGKLVMTIGEVGVPGVDEGHFNEPTDLAWFPDGSFVVADGYINSRVVKFDKNGKFLVTWGDKGTNPGQFQVPHSIATDKNRRVYVGDRSNKRIQVFDENGKFLDMWPNMTSPYTILMSKDQHLWVGDGTTNRISKYDANGKFLYGWGISATIRSGAQPGWFDGPHQMSVDQEGNLYVAEVWSGRVQKFRPKKGADPAKLVQSELRWPTT